MLRKEKALSIFRINKSMLPQQFTMIDISNFDNKSYDFRNIFSAKYIRRSYKCGYFIWKGNNIYDIFFINFEM